MLRKAFIFVGIMVVGILGLGQTFSGEWQGKSFLFPDLNIDEAKLTLKSTLAGWKLKSESIFDADGFSEQLFHFHGYAFQYRVTVEGKGSFSPRRKVMKRVHGKLLDGTEYDQLVWEFPGPFYKYSWIKATIPFLGGELSAKAYHRMPYYSQDIRSLYWDYRGERAYRWDAGLGRWVPTYKDPLCVGVEAFVGSARIEYWDPKTGWKEKWENYLLLSFDPTNRERPFELAPEAVAYLNEKYSKWEFLYWRTGPNYYFKVYHWMKPSMEYTLSFKPELPEGFGTVKVEALFTESPGIRFSELTLGFSQVSLCCGMKADAELTFTKDEWFSDLVVTVERFPICCGIGLDLGITWTVSEKSVAIKPVWEGIEGCVSVYGDVAMAENAVTGIKLYGSSLSCRHGGFTIEALHVFERPPYPYPGWYKNAHFKKVEATDKYENELLSLSRKWKACWGTAKLGLSMYFSEGTGSLFEITRFAFYSSIPIAKDWLVDLSLWTDDPSTLPVEPSLLVNWKFKF